MGHTVRVQPASGLHSEPQPPHPQVGDPHQTTLFKGAHIVSGCPKDKPSLDKRLQGSWPGGGHRLSDPCPSSCELPPQVLSTVLILGPSCSVHNHVRELTKAAWAPRGQAGSEEGLSPTGGEKRHISNGQMPALPPSITEHSILSLHQG